jgi:uncharacterized protein
MEGMSELFPVLLVMALSGALAGFLAGLMGIGGGIVTVPVLYYALGILGVPAAHHMQITVATSLAIIVPTAIFSARAHHRKGAVDLAIVKSWAPWVGIGAVAGVFLAAHMKNDALVFFFAVIAAIMGLKLLLPFDERVIGKTIPAGQTGRNMGLAIGGFSSMMGIGGATFSVPLMTLYAVPIHRAVGTASLLGLIIAVPASIGYIWSGLGNPLLPTFSLGYVNLVGVAVIAPLSSAMAPVGALVAHRTPRRLLSIIFGVFLLLTAFRMGLPDLWQGFWASFGQI